eukprot:TRINITY_DN4525_c0_g1_i1.p1 TRINITY_DN4525_c0_g1~~TRINITY_DN4525_c0_g1_i1.p1  ORF type:complete len:1040 (-),score=265.36 TRINITY_DN4525_c0_g1_i1:132-3251(-)
MAEEETESAFEIIDFTVASQWEKVIAKLEDVIKLWGLSKDNVPTPSKISSPSSSSHNNNNNNSLDSSLDGVSEIFSISGRSYKLTFYGEPISFSIPRTEKNKAEKYEHFSPEMNLMIDSNIDFPSRAHHLQRWYGIHNFFMISTVADTGTDLQEATQLLSTITIAMHNTECHIPVFIPLFDKKRGMYVGYMHSNQNNTGGISVKFSSETIGRVPNHLNHLDGLINLFHLKILHGVDTDANNPVEPLTKNTSVSTRFTYMKSYSSNTEWRNLQGQGIDTIYWGPTVDPIEGLLLAVEWSPDSCPKGRFWVDNTHSTDFRPQRAPNWFLKVLYGSERWYPLVACLKGVGTALSEAIGIASMEILFQGRLGIKPKDLTTQKDTTQKDAMQTDDEEEINEPVQNAEEKVEFVDNSKSFISTVGNITRSLASSIGGPLLPSSQEIDALLRELFVSPQNSPNSPSSPNANFSPRIQTPPSVKNARASPAFSTPSSSTPHLQPISTPQNRQSPNITSKPVYKTLSFKGAPPSSLLSSLSIACLSIQALPAIALIWIEFVKEIRWYWEHSIPIPRIPLPTASVSNSMVDLDCCLLYQKLQMLNYCIQAKTKERRNRKGDVNTEDMETDSVNNDNNNEENMDGKLKGDWGNEEEEIEKEVEKEKNSADGWSDEEIYFSGDEGQSSKKQSENQKVPEIEENSTLKNSSSILADQYLLYEETPIVIPLIQDSGPMTEDMLQEQEELFSKLGTTSEAQEIRARMQTAQLSSDMQAFKAANPGCVLEDFVRWHSPRDWTTDKTEEGSTLSTEQESERNGRGKGEGFGRDGFLSLRMKTNGLWREIWTNATPKTIEEQPQIFQSTKEAEKVLHYLETLPPADVVYQLMATALIAVIQHFTNLTQGMGNNIPVVNESINNFIASLKENFPTSAPEDKSSLLFDPIWKEAEVMETVISRAQSLTYKLQSYPHIASSLLIKQEIPVPKDDRDGISSLFSILGNQKELPDPDAREFIVRCNVPRPNPLCKTVPNKMYALITPNELKIALALGLDECE